MGLLLNWFEIVLLLAILAIVAYAVIAKRRPGGLSVLEAVEQAASGPDTRDSRAEFLDTLKRTSREIAGELKAREACMRTLLGEADDRIAALTELLTKLELVAPDSQRPTPEQPSVAQPAARLREEPPQDMSRGEGASETGRGGRLAIHDSIRMLAQEGKRPEEIAKQLGVGTGEVVLVLGLANRN